MAVGAVLTELIAPGWVGPVLAAAPPTIGVSVACSQPPAFAVRVQGTDFAPFTVVLVTFDAALGGQPESFDAQTDGFGRFDVTIRPGPRRPGTFQVRADDLREREATALTALDCVPVFHPQLRFKPGVTRRGWLVTLVGTAFPPNAQVAIAWGGLRSRGLPATLSTDSSGVLVVPRQVLVFQETEAGTTIEAVASPGGAERFDPVRARLLVVPGPAEPPTFNRQR